ncbi:MAG: site-2 protease family protein, partial [Ignavibacteriae bacterium]|nr:site-2 protease family protein [Ignavibacteriota bacterium]
MYSQSLQLGRIFGIPIGVNYSWFIVFALITMSLTTQFNHLHPEWSFAEHLTLGIATSILFFTSVLLHELGHSVLALRYRIPVQSITLFIFGGVAAISREPEKPSHEFNIAIAGPAVSAILGALFYGLASVTRGTMEGVASLGQWLGYINMMLAGFNLIPGFPLDGGRILRSIVWKYTQSFERATTIASWSGQFFAYAFIFFGIWQALTGNFFGGLWIGFIGWFLLNAAQATGTQVNLRAAMRGITAADVMTQECLRLPGNISVADLVENHMLRTGSRCAFVAEGDRFRGLVTMHEIKQVPKDEWHVTPLQAIMVSEDEVLIAEPDVPVDLVL